MSPSRHHSETAQHLSQLCKTDYFEALISRMESLGSRQFSSYCMKNVTEIKFAAEQQEPGLFPGLISLLVLIYLNFPQGM